MTKLYSYVVARDYGFAPNPFYGSCTLATCKPEIRKHAKVGDWIIGTGSSQSNQDGYLVYAMLVSETLTFNDYWESVRFQQKRSNLRGSKKQAFGDNIYFKDTRGCGFRRTPIIAVGTVPLTRIMLATTRELIVYYSALTTRIGATQGLSYLRYLGTTTDLIFAPNGSTSAGFRRIWLEIL